MVVAADGVAVAEIGSSVVVDEVAAATVANAAVEDTSPCKNFLRSWSCLRCWNSESASAPEDGDVASSARQSLEQGIDADGSS